MTTQDLLIIFGPFFVLAALLTIGIIWDYAKFPG